MDARTPLDAALGTVLDAVRPLEAALQDEILFRELMVALGWGDPDSPIDLAAIDGYLGIAALLPQARQALETVRGGDVPSPEQLEALVNAVSSLVEQLASFAEAPPPAGLPDPLSRPEFWADLAGRLVGHLLIEYLVHAKPLTFAALYLVGVIDDEGPSDERRVLRWDRLGPFVREPATIVRDVYGWGAAFDHRRLLVRVEHTLQAAGLLAQRTLVPSDDFERHYGPGTEVPANLSELTVPLVIGTDESATYELGLLGLPIPRPAGSVPEGLYISAYASGELSAEAEIAPDTTIRFAGALDASGGAGIRLWPGTVAPFFEIPAASAELSIELAYEPAEAWVVFGGSDGTNATLNRAAIGLELTGPVEDMELRLRSALDNLTVRLDLGEADGFLAQLLGASEVSTTTSIGLAWSSKSGLRLEGGALRLVQPLTLRLGPVELSAISFEVAPGPDGLTASASVVVKAALGPVRAAVDSVGASLTMTSREDGALGGLAFDPGFKPPSGVALSVDAGAVTGGGFLFFDWEKQQYAGGLHLEFERITLNAIGLLTTRMPDGSPGFSLLIIVQASGFAPIQLGFGFTLNGVGGLLGVNRTVVVDVLRAGVKNRTLDSILFSQDDPTPRAPQIVSTLQGVFPPAPNRYLFGPMALIGWGTPTLLTIEVALILELPAPLRLIILGRLRAALPKPDAAIVKLNLDAVGIVDFDRRELSVDASLYDSTIGPFALTGDMAARASWGERPDFALALGGCHPAFALPPGFPALQRLALTLSTGNNPRLRMEAYLALTSNTVQVGARLEFYVAVAGFSLEGGFGFDTLIQFSPFRLMAEIFARLQLKRGSKTLMGISIHVHLVGPAPWEVWGEARFDILFISFTIPFRATFGRPEPTPLAASEEIWPRLEEALAADVSWAAQLPEDAGRLAVLRADAAGAETLVHPLGSLTVSQRVVPLERTLTLFGAAPPKDYDSFAIVEATGLQIADDVFDHFAPAQFRRMSDAEKLSSPSFERMVAGARLKADKSTRVGYVQDTPLDYETSIILDVETGVPEPLDELYAPSVAELRSMAEHGPAGTAELRNQGRARFAPDETGPGVDEPEYTVATREGLEEVELAGLDGTYTTAAELLARHAERDDLQIVRKEEALPA